MGIEVKVVMDREKVAQAIHNILDVGIDLITKKVLEKEDYGKLKAIRTLSSTINAATIMIQQETAQQRHAIIYERMKQLGYESDTKQIA